MNHEKILQELKTYFAKDLEKAKKSTGDCLPGDDDWIMAEMTMQVRKQDLKKIEELEKKHD